MQEALKNLLPLRSNLRCTNVFIFLSFQGIRSQRCSGSRMRGRCPTPAEWPLSSRKTDYAPWSWPTCSPQTRGCTCAGPATSWAKPGAQLKSEWRCDREGRLLSLQKADGPLVRFHGNMNEPLAAAVDHAGAPHVDVGNWRLRVLHLWLSFPKLIPLGHFAFLNVVRILRSEIAMATGPHYDGDCLYECECYINCTGAY